MKFLHYQLELGQSDCIQVSLDKQANVRLLDSTNFQHYKTGRRHQFYGGIAKQSPYNLRPPWSGKWHLVIDLGGYSGSVRASVNVI